MIVGVVTASRCRSVRTRQGVKNPISRQALIKNSSRKKTARLRSTPRLLLNFRLCTTSTKMSNVTMLLTLLVIVVLRTAVFLPSLSRRHLCKMVIETSIEAVEKTMLINNDLNYRTLNRLVVNFTIIIGRTTFTKVMIIVGPRHPPSRPKLSLKLVTNTRTTMLTLRNLPTTLARRI